MFIFNGYKTTVVSKRLFLGSIWDQTHVILLYDLIIGTNDILMPMIALTLPETPILITPSLARL